MNSASFNRERYIPDGVFNGPMLALASVPVMGAALLGAWLMDLLYGKGLFLVFVIFVFAGCLVGVAAGWAVKVARCRHPFYAFVMGGIAGSLCFVASLYFGMVRVSPPGNPAPAWLLPRYVHFRMMNQVIQFHRMPGDPPAENSPNLVEVGVNYFFLGMEGLGLLFIPAWMANSQAWRPYTAEVSRWHRRVKFQIRTGIGSTAIRALVNGSLEEFAQILAAGRSSQVTKYQCAIDFVDVPDRSPLEFPVYISVGDDPANGAGQGLSQMKLTLEECLALRSLFPDLAARLEEESREKLPAPVHVATTVSPPSPRADTRVLPGRDPEPRQLDHVAVLEQTLRDRVLSDGNRTRVGFMTGLPTAYLIFSFPIGLAIGGISLDARELGVSNYLFSAMGWLILLSGIVGMVLRVIWYSRSLEGSLWWKHLQASLKDRPERLVNLDDPEAVFVGVVDIDQAIKKRRVVLKDIGLARADSTSRVLLLECDEGRYRIPMTSIIHCRPSLLTKDRPDSFMVDLMFRSDSGVAQLYLDVMLKDFAPCSRKCYLGKVNEFLRSIAALAG